MSLKIILSIVALLAVGGTVTTVVVRQRARVARPVVQSEPVAVATKVLAQAEVVKQPETTAEQKPDSKLETKVMANIKITVNGIALSAVQIAGLTQLYGQAVAAGNYWYDARSGLYGRVGEGSIGVMGAGMSFGTLARSASHGNTGVFVNGRELAQPEWTVLSQLVGTPVQAGAYWLDASGQAGVEGNPIPIVNLSVAGKASAGGDNFWSSRAGAGNANADNSQGYVSVPGVGPVGYGF